MCEGKPNGRFETTWMEGGRRTRAERKVNWVGRYLIVTVWDVDKKPHHIAIPMGGYQCAGWRQMAEAIVGLEKAVAEGQHRNQRAGKTSRRGYESHGYEGPEAQHINVKGSTERVRLDLESRCMVGWVRGSSNGEFCLKFMEEWGKEMWKLVGELRMASMGGEKILMEFENSGEATYGLKKGRCMFRVMI